VQADGSIHEDQLLTFLVDTIDEGVEFDLAPNAETRSEDIHEDLLGACADGTSVSTLSSTGPSTNCVDDRPTQQ
jgi:hypothetical protein